MKKMSETGCIGLKDKQDLIRCKNQHPENPKIKVQVISILQSIKELV